MGKLFTMQHGWDDADLDEALTDNNIIHESETPARQGVAGIVIECESLADQIAVEEFITKLRSK